MMDKKITMIMRENQRLLLSWTMDLAGLMRSRYDMEKKAALEKAHLNRNLVMYLGEGVVTFVYEEADGTEREARGTARGDHAVRVVERIPHLWPFEEDCFISSKSRPRKGRHGNHTAQFIHARFS